MLRNESPRFDDISNPITLNSLPDWSATELEALRKHAPELEGLTIEACLGSSRPLANSARRRAARKVRDLAEAGDAISQTGQIAAAALTKAVNTLDDRLDQIDEAEGLTTPKASAGRWAYANGTPVRILDAAEKLAPEVPRTDYTPGDYMLAMAGLHRDGQIKAALSEGTDSAGGYTVPTIVLPQWIDRLRAAQVCVRAGARTLMLDTNVTKLARLDTDPTAAWRSENGAFTASDPTFSAMTFTARSLYAFVKVSYELLQDSVNITDILNRALINALATEIDRVCLFGSGTPPEPQGVFGTSGIQSVSMGTNGATPSAYTQVLSLLQALEDANVPQTTALIAAPRTKYKYAGLADSTGQPLLAPSVVSAVPMLSTTAVPVNQTQGTSSDCSSIIAGDFRQMVIGIRQDLRLQMLSERFLSDNGQIGFIAHMRVDVQLEHAASFGKLIGIRP